MRSLVFVLCATFGVLAAQTATAGRYISHDNGLRPDQILAAIEQYGSEVTLFCNDFSVAECKGYAEAGAHVVLNETDYSIYDVLSVIKAVETPTQVTYISSGLDGFELSQIAAKGVYMDIQAQVNVGASEMKKAVRAAPTPSRVKVHVRDASITDADSKELRELGATVAL